MNTHRHHKVGSMEPDEEDNGMHPIFLFQSFFVSNLITFIHTPKFST